MTGRCGGGGSGAEGGKTTLPAEGLSMGPAAEAGLGGSVSTLSAGGGNNRDLAIPPGGALGTLRDLELADIAACELTTTGFPRGRPLADSCGGTAMGGGGTTCLGRPDIFAAG
mmetsp:Transcript_127989/g.239483  ORF Transcript_127989/g.239483 Transcript_127989/m.239483 type:complete len:113 (-) Transcript_127989:677-1015(-)